ncbi:MAG TPA: hypothetical protein VN947_19765 [Polyangia bacterium]|nr:hypothetical protein [Polyangia bacterium]
MRWPPLALVLCSTAALANAPPASLDRPAVVAGMTAIRPQLQACAARHHVAGVAVVAMTIAPAGTVARAAIEPPSAGWGDVPPDSPAAACLVRAVEDARFPAFQGAPLTLAYPIVLRPR